MNIRAKSKESIKITAMSYPTICSPLKNHPVNCAKDSFRGLDFADCGF